jgi:hypothetical protein
MVKRGVIWAMNVTTFLAGFAAVVAPTFFDHVINLIGAHGPPGTPGFRQHPLDVLWIPIGRGPGALRWFLQDLKGHRQPTMGEMGRQGNVRRVDAGVHNQVLAGAGHGSEVEVVWGGAGSKVSR